MLSAYNKQSDAATVTVTVIVTETLVLRLLQPRAHHRVNPYPGARRQNETEMCSDHDETSPSIAAISAISEGKRPLSVFEPPSPRGRG